MASYETISSGQTHHVFYNPSDGKNIILEVENTDFEVEPDRVAVKISYEVWNQIVEDYTEKFANYNIAHSSQLELNFKKSTT